MASVSHLEPDIGSGTAGEKYIKRYQMAYFLSYLSAQN